MILSKHISHTEWASALIEIKSYLRQKQFKHTFLLDQTVDKLILFDSWLLTLLTCSFAINICFELLVLQASVDPFCDFLELTHS